MNFSFHLNKNVNNKAHFRFEIQENLDKWHQTLPSSRRALISVNKFTLVGSLSNLEILGKKTDNILHIIHFIYIILNFERLFASNEDDFQAMIPEKARRDVAVAVESSAGGRRKNK